MSIPDDREDMRHFLDRLTPAQVRHLRLLVSHDSELSEAATSRTLHAATPSSHLPADFLALAGSIHGPGDVAERHDDYIRQHLRGRFGHDE